MTPERWLNAKNELKDKFEILDEGQTLLEEEGGITIDHIEFTSPMGRIRLEFITKPVILDKKTSYSKRIGSETQVDYIYSQDELSHQLAVYKWNENDSDWEEIDSKMFDK
jgi:hypothetical protein